jgi:hypothetical protein
MCDTNYPIRQVSIVLSHLAEVCHVFSLLVFHSNLAGGHPVYVGVPLFLSFVMGLTCGRKRTPHRWHAMCI